MGLSDLLSRAASTVKAGVIGSAEAAPLTSLGVTGSLAGAVAKPVLDSVFKDPLHDEIMSVTEGSLARLQAQRKQERLTRLMAINTARLAAVDPHTYNEVLAGRRLAPGTEVFGGEPRVDLMNQLAANMAKGQYGFPEVDQLGPPTGQ